MKVEKFIKMCDNHIPAENVLVDGYQVFLCTNMFEVLMGRKVRSFKINFLTRELSIFTKEGALKYEAAK